MKMRLFDSGENHSSAPQTKYGSRGHSVLALVQLSILIASLFWPGSSVRADSIHQKYDSSWLPIDSLELKHQLTAASHDPKLLYNLVRRAGQQDKAGLAYDTLNDLRHSQPDNAVVLAGYCLAFDVASGGYTFINHNRVERRFSNTDDSECQGILMHARRLDPHLWLTYAVEGYRLADKPNATSVGIALLQKAVKLAPDVSITHYLLGRVYTYGTPSRSFERAAQELQTAISLKPPMSAASLLLFMVYSLWLPDRAKAVQAKHSFLGTIPPDTTAKIAPELQPLLEKYP